MGLHRSDHVRRRPDLRDIANLKNALQGVDVTDAFLPVVAPASVYWLHNEYYASDEEFIYAVADALHEEYKAIVDAGLLVQVDDEVLMHEADLIQSLGGSGRTTASGRSYASRLSTTRSAASPRIASATTSVGKWHARLSMTSPLRDVVDLILRVNAYAY